MNHSKIPPTRILWASSRHQIACPEHAPRVGGDEFWAGQWHVFGEHEQVGYQRARGHAAQCTACMALAEVAALGGEVDAPIGDGTGGVL
jgi:hypothetical protein